MSNNFKNELDYTKNDNEYVTMTFSGIEPPLRDCIYQSQSGKKGSNTILSLLPY